MNSLPFYKEICHELVQSSVLAIFSKGTGCEHIASHICNAYADPSHFYAVTGFESDTDLLMFYTHIRRLNKNALVHCIKSATTVRERTAMYRKKGLFVCYSARPLLMDLLHDRLQVELIQGICILSAHMLLADECSAECFLLYKLHSYRKARICAVSECPEAFLGPGKLAHAMASVLFCSNVSFYPRFHSLLKKSLELRQPDVVEVRIPLTNAMRKVQSVLFGILSELLRELTSHMEKCGYTEYKVPALEAVLDGKFLRHLKKLFASGRKVNFTGKVSFKVKSLLKTFTSIGEMVDALKRLYLLDPVSFSIFCDRLVHISKGDGIDVSMWLHTKEAHLLVPTAIDYRDDFLKRKTTGLSENRKILTKEGFIHRLLQKSENQKKRILLVLKSWVITDESDMSFCSTENVDSVLHSAIYQTFLIFHDCPTLCGIVNEIPLCMGWCLPRAVKAETEEIDAQHITSSVDEMVQKLYHKSRDIQEIPDVVVLCGFDLKSIRRAELLQALLGTFSSKKLQIYLVAYDGSIEQCVYLNEAKVEKDAFTELIATRANLVFPELCTEKDDHKKLIEHCTEASEMTSTQDQMNHIWPKRKESHSSTIIVDEREFRSSLPFQLFRIGKASIIPRTLFCGDYVLSDDVVVERKSAADLDASLTNGRLFSQIYTMLRSYSVCLILIESGSSSFFEDEGEKLSAESSKQAKCPSSKTSASKILTDFRVIEKLCMVAKCFRGLRFLWSTCDEETASLFMEIKSDRVEPIVPADIGTIINKDPKKSTNATVFDATSLKSILGGQRNNLPSLDLLALEENDMLENTHDSDPCDSFAPYTSQILLNLPGITHTNISKLTSKFRNLADISCASLIALIDAVESEHNGNLLYEALHKNYGML